jgi:scyllo-inositol 2-dehydrogenase (NADP+)
MRVIVVGLGVQGEKRRRFAGADFVTDVDPLRQDARHRDVREVALDAYDAALVCTPDEPKIELLSYLLERGKHVLVEKPLWAADDGQIAKLQELARKNSAVCYTAYNHRFEPHFVAMRDVIASGKLGTIYRCRMFYGNGTARLVRDSEWRDKGAGVLPDLGSHLLDTLVFWFGKVADDFRVTSASHFENRAPDHVVMSSESSSPKTELEMTLLMWRNHFTCDVLAENGSAHIESLCKWGPSKLTVRTRLLPSGRPPEETVTLVQDDPTWALEYAHFKKLVAERQRTDLSTDLWLNRTIRELSAQALRAAK